MDKVVVLAAGLGKRMRAGDGEGLTEAQHQVAETGVKALVPIDRPFLDYVLSTVADAGFRQVCLVIGPGHDELRHHYSDVVEARRLRFEFAVQAEPLGTADAVAAAREFVGNEPFLSINADNHYPLTALQALRRLSGPGLPGFDRRALVAQSNIPEERIERFAVIDVDESGGLRRVVEKPSAAQIAELGDTVGVSMNCWRFDERIFAACAAIEPSPRGEVEITDAVEYAVDRLGVRFEVVPVQAPVLDLSSREDIESVVERLRGLPVHL
ncbi:MAG TPA: nucleotidyltransferase family protein [Candidatus Latescibacteria bacterium]|jgi:glucose-1-phosphate thymidylyltransferase|nr:glucose-1-phosphate thymidylyltransferase [Gemmatimonadaceae bacterium]MDP6015845.1 nucleotidyltransferase family protein [Candidatus Latescibacterota bacterium]HJP29158.1 nucleotidyltransferase family protein [Candidatus Latescibacterota bacterium]